MNTKKQGDGGDDVTLAREAFAKALRLQMADVGVDKRGLSRLTRANGADGFSDGTIGRWARAEVAPRWDEQVVIAEALGIDLGDLHASAVAIYKRLKAGGTSPDLTPETA